MIPTPSQVQTALDFLVWLRSAEDGTENLEGLPASIDYEALAALARRSGYQVTAIAAAEAFRMFMRVRAFSTSRGSARA